MGKEPCKNYFEITICCKIIELYYSFSYSYKGRREGEAPVVSSKFRADKVIKNALSISRFSLST